MSSHSGIDEIQEMLSSLACRIIPTSFNPHDVHLQGFPIPAAWKWHSCEAALNSLRPNGVMMRLPLFWQLEVPLWYACRAASAPIFLNDPENMPVGAAAIQRGGIDTVVTEQRDAEQFAAYLQAEHAALPQKWHVVHRAEDSWSIPAELLHHHVTHEVHLFPGLPILSQCTALMNDIPNSNYFHLAAEGDFNESDCTLDTPATTDGIPSFRLQLPHIRAEAQACTCGKRIYVSNT